MIDPLPSDIFRPGQVLNNTYEVEGVLGRGGTGEVYLARNQVTGRVFAIKALNRQFSANEDYVELMKREEEMRTILHPAVVRYNECSRTDDGHVYLVMDYIAGPSLADVMTERRVDPRELLIIAHRVAEGLVETHRHGIVHRDLSPDNIILRDGKPEEATIIDFGIAKDTAAGARTIVGNEFAGKYEYAAPEQLDGHSEPRTDLYALGATLLAAFAGETPYLGTTPGEIVRRKQRPLDTERVPEPLKGLIDALTSPDIAARPASAEAAVERIGGLLKPSGKRPSAPGRRASREAREPRKRGGGLGLVAGIGLPLLIAAGGFGAWSAGLFDSYFAEPIPVASPFTLTAAHPSEGTPTFATHAPDEATGALLARAFASATGATPAPDAVGIAQGMPLPEWAELSADLMGRAGTLEDWSLTVEDTSVSIAGIAPDRGARDAMASELEAFSGGTGLSIRYALRAGPRELAKAEIAQVLADYATCGPLRVEGPEVFQLGEEVVITGDFVRQTDITALENSVIGMIGDRTVRVQGTVLNEQLCRVRPILPPTPPANLSTWLGNGDDGSANLTGVYRTGENPIADLLMPADIGDAYILVMVVDIKGVVFPLIPNINAPEQRISELGRVEGGIRRIRLLHSRAEKARDPSLLAAEIDDGNYGKSEIIAILSTEPIFDGRRPSSESVASFAGALEEALEGREDIVVGVSVAIIDAQP